MSSQPIKLAILDDYASIAPPHFAALSRHNIQVDTFPTTLNAKDTNGRAALIERLKPYTIISSMRERTAFPRSLLEQLPNLKVLLTTAMRNAAIDMVACKELNITVVGTGGHGSGTKGYDATNEQTWALILALAKDVPSGDAVIKRGTDDTDPNAESGGWQTTLGTGLSGKTLGLLGLGRLGVQCAVTGTLGFGMKVIAWSTSLTQEKADEMAASRGLEKGTFKVVGSKKELFQQADVLSVHYVLSDRSRGIVGADELGVMKNSALVINTSRGPLIDESALISALEKGMIRGAALDVFDVEPLPKGSPWRRDGFWGKEGRGRVVLSPHMGYVEEGTMHDWYDQQCRAVVAWTKGEEIQGIIQ
jgi:lactate dehydrogenase-like 2-hydroxyacid dehydrogenase